MQGGIAPAQASGANRDGSHDFDFLLGHWKTHYRRMRHPLSGSQSWYAFEGTSNVNSLLGGGADIEDGSLEGPRGRYQGLTLRMYDPKTHEWNLFWGTAKTGLGLPPQVGHFSDNGLGDFFCDDVYDGKAIIVRYEWSRHNAQHPYFEQAFSTDRGKTWEVNWTTLYSR